MSPRRWVTPERHHRQPSIELSKAFTHVLSRGEPHWPERLRRGSSARFFNDAFNKEIIVAGQPRPRLSFCPKPLEVLLLLTSWHHHHAITATAGTGMGNTVTLENRCFDLPDKRHRGGCARTCSPATSSLATKLCACTCRRRDAPLLGHHLCPASELTTAAPPDPDVWSSDPAKGGIFGMPYIWNVWSKV
jgi:hypothetical protein